MAPKFMFFMLYSLLATLAYSESPDAGVMKDLNTSLNPQNQLGWSDPDCCKWKNVGCTGDGRVTRIQIGHQNLGGTLPVNLNKLSSLQVLELQDNQLTGPLPSLSGLDSLMSLLLSNNNFTSIPIDFFNGMTALTSVYLDYNPFSPWSIPQGIINSSTLQTFSAISANINGALPDFLTGDKFSSLTNLHLSFNSLEGPIPSSFSGSSIQSLWLNGQRSFSKLNGSLAVLGNMTQLTEVWLHGNSFTGPLPDFKGLGLLQNFSVRDNVLTGPVPDSLVNLTSLMVVNLTNNFLQGKMPVFNRSVQVDIGGRNRFCLPDGKECDPRVYSLLNVVRDLGYPSILAEDWSGNNPCQGGWRGITCNPGGNITIVNLANLQLTGTISANFSQIVSLERLILSGNRLTGKIPPELTSLPSLVDLDVSNNLLHGVVPSFRSTVSVKTTGNVNIGKEDSTPTTDGGNADSTGSGNSGENKKNIAGIVVGSIFGALVSMAVVGGFVFYFYKRKRSNRVQSPLHMILHPPSESNDAIKISIANSSLNGGISETHSHGSSGPSDLHIVEAGNLVISIQVLRNVTNNFSEENILGRGGFGTVYKGELHDGTKIAVKRMESGVMSEKGLDEFKSEISVLTKVRHRHLVALLGYCLDGNERLLVYEYMPQGTLSRYLFDWKEEGLKPLEWMKRLIIALDVARGVEYLHGLAQQSFIHRDLKPSNILLGDDLRAKVADFGLVRLADGKASIATKLAGTFGYLAPEYAVTGRVSTKIDVYSFGVILMEIITGRKALDESKPDDSQHLVPWFRRMLINKETFHKAIDPTLDILNEETLASINTVSELAGHCSVREPYQRPDMGHVVNVLSSLAELWKPSDPVDPDDLYGIDYDMTLPQAVKKWQALEGMTGFDCSSSSFMGSNDNTQTSIPTRPSGFANSFASSDGR